MVGPAALRRSWYLAGVVGVLVLASAWRIGMAVQLPVISRDGVTFCWYARELERTGVDYLQTPAAQQHPGFPALLLATTSLAKAVGMPDGPWTWQRCGQGVCILAGLVVIGLVGLLTARLVRGLVLPIDRRLTVMLAMLLAALLDLNVWLSADVMSEQVHLAFYLGAVVLLTRLDSARAAVGCGLLSGLAFMTREEGFVPLLAGLLTLGAAWRSAPVRRLVTQAILLLAGFLVCAAPYWLTVGRFSTKKGVSDLWESAAIRPSTVTQDSLVASAWGAWASGPCEPSAPRDGRVSSAARVWGRAGATPYPEGVQGCSHGRRRPQAAAARGKRAPGMLRPEGAAERRDVSGTPSGCGPRGDQPRVSSAVADAARGYSPSPLRGVTEGDHGRAALDARQGECRCPPTMYARLKTLDLSWYALLPHAFYKLFRAGRVVIPLLAVFPLINLRRRWLTPPLVGPLACAAGHFGLALLVLAGKGYLDPRHMLVPAVLLIPLAALVLGRLVTLASEARRAWLGVLAVLICVAPLVRYSLRVPNSKDLFLADAAAWLDGHDGQLASKRLLTAGSPRRIAFYTEMRWEVWDDQPVNYAELAGKIRSPEPGYFVIQVPTDPAGAQYEFEDNDQLLTRLLTDPGVGPCLRIVHTVPGPDRSELRIFELVPPGRT